MKWVEADNSLDFGGLSGADDGFVGCNFGEVGERSGGMGGDCC